MKRNLIHAAIPAVLILFVLLLGLLARTFRRTHLAEHCWSCGARKVRKSETRYAFDPAARLLLLSPSRCSGCLTRFYRFRLPTRFGLARRSGQGSSTLKT